MATRKTTKSSPRKTSSKAKTTKRTTKAKASKQSAKKAPTKKASTKKTKQPTKAKGEAAKAPADMKPVVSAFVADEAKAARKDDSAVGVRKGSQAEAAIRVLADANPVSLTHAEVVDGCKAKRVTIKWPVGLLRNLEKRGLVEKFKGENGRVAFALTAKGIHTAKSL